MSVSVTQISVSSESGRTFFLKVDWVEDLGAGFTIALSDCESAWMGEVSEEEVQQEAEELEMRKENYVKELQQALTGVGRSGGGYVFRLTPRSPQQDRTRCLTYEKVQQDISFRLGSVELLPCPEPDRVIKELLCHSLQCSTELQAQNQKLMEENQHLCCEQDRITTELQRHVQGKESLERELYARFVLLLNEKKAKIRDLKERFRQLQEQLEEREKSLAAVVAAAGPEEAPLAASSDEETQDLALSQVSTVPDVTSQCTMDVDLSDIPNMLPNRTHLSRRGPGSEVTEGSWDQRQSGRWAEMRGGLPL